MLIRLNQSLRLKKGKWYVCIKDLFDNYANKAFRKGDIYLSTQDGSLIPSNSNVPFEVVCSDTYFRDWTIQDAKGAFIEKAEKAIIEWAGTYISKTTGGGVEERKVLAVDLLNYFKNYMKEE